MKKHKYKEGESIITIHGDVGLITALQTSKVDTKDIPSYWIEFSRSLHPDGKARNIWEETILDRCYTLSDAYMLKTDIDVLSLPKRIYCASHEAMFFICDKLSQCHIGYSNNYKEKFIQT